MGEKTAASGRVPTWSRTGLPVVAAVAAALAVTLAAYTRETRATGLDLWVDDRAVPRLEPLRRGLVLFTEVAGPTEVLIAAVVLAAACLALRLPRAAVVSVAGPVGAMGVTQCLQPALARPAVEGAGYAFPSGHATAAFSLATVLVLLVLPGGALFGRVPVWCTAILLVLAVALPAYVGAALLLLRHHYVTDVLGGAGVAVAVVLLLASALDHFVPLTGAGLFVRRGSP